MKRAVYFSDNDAYQRHVHNHGLLLNKPFIVEGDECLNVEVLSSEYRQPTTTLKNLYKELYAYGKKLMENGDYRIECYDSKRVANADALLRVIKYILKDSHEGTVDIANMDFNYKVIRNSDGTHDISLMFWGGKGWDPLNETLEPTYTSTETTEPTEPTEPTLTQQFVDWIDCKVGTDTWKMGNVHLCRITFDNPVRNCINIWVNKIRIAKIDYHFNITITDDSYKQGALDVFNMIKKWYNEYLGKI